MGGELNGSFSGIGEMRAHASSAIFPAKKRRANLAGNQEAAP
jgi:hypothetical protein